MPAGAGGSDARGRPGRGEEVRREGKKSIRAHVAREPARPTKPKPETETARGEGDS